MAAFLPRSHHTKESVIDVRDVVRVVSLNSSTCHGSSLLAIPRSAEHAAAEIAHTRTLPVDALSAREDSKTSTAVPVEGAEAASREVERTRQYNFSIYAYATYHKPP